MAAPFYLFVIGTLVVWRITHLLYGEDGPWDVVVRLRRVAGDGFWASLLDCFYCLSLWVSLPLAFAIANKWGERLLLWPALSAGAILLERFITKERGNSSISYIEDEESNRVLRTEQKQAPDSQSK